VDRLKQFEIGKTVKALSKDATMPATVQEHSRQLLGKWMAIVNLQAPMETPATNTSDQLDEDLTGLDLNALNSLQFDPDNFNSLILDTEPIGDLIPVSTVDASALLEPPADQLSEYQVNNRDGKMYIKVNQNNRENSETVAGTTAMDAPKENEAPTPQEGATPAEHEATGERKRSRKDPTMKKVPGGKPPLRTYESLYEDKDKKTKDPK
jgi:hypothetical protein